MEPPYLFTGFGEGIEDSYGLFGRGVRQGGDFARGLPTTARRPEASMKVESLASVSDFSRSRCKELYNEKEDRNNHDGRYGTHGFARARTANQSLTKGHATGNA
jgi:hypothetical protein